MHLIEQRDIPALEKFIKNNNNLINCYVTEQCTPLDIAIGSNAGDVAKLLLENGADPNLSQHDAGYNSPLIRACYMHDLDISVIEKLLEHGANVNAGHLSSGGLTETPLMAACYMGKLKLIECLLKHHADANVNIDGVTALEMTIDSSHYKNKAERLAVIKLLLLHGAVFNPNQKIASIEETMEGTKLITMKEYVKRYLGEDVLRIILASSCVKKGSEKRVRRQKVQ